MRTKSVILGNDTTRSFYEISNRKVLNQLKCYAEFPPGIVSKVNLEQYKEYLSEVEAAFSTWGMPAFTEEEIKSYFPKLKAVFFAAGGVQYFARPFIQNGVKIISAWAANAVPVAEFSMAQIILANKGFFQSTVITKRDYSLAGEFCNNYPGNYSVNTGILGAGMIGTKVIELLKPFHHNIMVFDPFLSDERAECLGVRKTSLEEVFSKCQTISNHLANKKETEGIINAKHFALMLPYATFINTGRGQQVVERDLITALKEQPGRTAVLDVTHPEPPEYGGELLTLDNVFISPHIAGSKANEFQRLAQYMLDEFMRLKNGEALKYEVTLESLRTMA